MSFDFLKILKELKSTFVCLYKNYKNRNQWFFQKPKNQTTILIFHAKHGPTNFLSDNSLVGLLGNVFEVLLFSFQPTKKEI
jgi:hypothetical protein